MTRLLYIQNKGFYFIRSCMLINGWPRLHYNQNINMMMKITSLYTCNNNQVLNVLINLWCVNSRKFFMASNRVLDTGSKDYNQHCSVLVSSQAIEIIQILSTKPKNVLSTCFPMLMILLL